jgi:predicted permease
MWTPANTYAGSPGADPWYTTYRNSFRVVARIPAGVVEEQLLTTASQAVRSVHMKRYAYDSTALVLSGPIVRSLGPARRAQEVTIATRLAGVALIVLLITCANVANLLLVRATRRRREIAVRRVLGVSAGRLYEQLLTESVLLAALGGAAALLFALWAATALRRLLLPGVQWSGGAVDLRTVLFAGIAALIVGVAAGLAPALNATQPDLTTALKSGREGGFRRSRLQSALLIAQAGLSVILLVGAGLFVTSLRNVRAIELGYDVERSLFIRPMFGATPPSATEIGAGLTQVGARLSSAPGVEAVGFASSLPMQGYSAMPIFLPDRDSLPALGDERGASFNSVSPGFLPAVGVQLIAGRNFNEGDREGSLGAVIVSRAMAHAFWPGQPAVGKCLILEKRANPCSIVVGVAEDVNRLIVIEKASMQYYLPLAQYPSVPADVAIRTNPENMAAVRALAGAELKRAFPSMTTPFIRVMRGSLESQYRPWRLGALLFTAFGALALLVAAIGVYSVVSYAVSQRVHEMGVRIALGAGVADILRLVARESITTVGLGVALGIVAALGLGRLVASLLYGISERDPVVLAASALVLCLVGVAASLVPAWRAARVDPVTALRAD